MNRATGPFDVTLTPTPADQAGAGEAVGRLTLDKRFHGGLEATSRGQMLAFRSAVEGSAGYVAMEHVTGTLEGRSGSFVLQHSGSMNRGASSLVVTVVPDSGTDDLAGLHGTMHIEIAGGGAHTYVFDYGIGAP